MFSFFNLLDEIPGTQNYKKNEKKKKMMENKEKISLSQTFPILELIGSQSSWNAFRLG